MKKKSKIILIVSIVMVLVLALSIVLFFTIRNNNIKKEKEGYLKAINNIADAIKEQCKTESNASYDGIITYKYLVEDKKLYTFNGYSTSNEIIKTESTLSVKDIPDNGVIELDKECNISLSVIYGDYSIIKKSTGNASIVEHEVYLDGEVVYFNPEEGKVCTNYKEENSTDLTKTGCMKWYILNDKKKNNTIKMILDHNTTSNTSFVTLNDYKNNSDTEYGNTLGPITVLNKLKSDTSSWNVKATLLSVDDISSMLDTKIYLDKEEDFFFETKKSKPLKDCYKGSTSNCKYSFLYDRTSTTCKDYGCLTNATTDTYGYWTSSVSSKDTLKAWRVYFDGRITLTNINDVSSGIRPVIEIQKSLLK